MPVIPIPPREKKRFLVSYLGDFFGHIVNAFNIDLFSSQGKVRVAKKIYPHTLNSDIAELTAPSAFTSAKINDGMNEVNKIWAVADSKVLSSPASTLPVFTSDTSTLLGTTDSGSDILSVRDPIEEELKTTPIAIPTGNGAFHITGEGNTTKWAQSFSSVSGPFTSLKLYLKRVGSPSDNLIISLQEDNAGVPSGTPLLTLTIPAGNLPTGFTLTEYPASDFSPPNFFFDVNKTYWWVFERSGPADTSHYVSIRLAFVEGDDPVKNPYKGGELKNWNGSTWTRAIAKKITETFTSNGSFTVPPGVTEIVVEGWGAGGGGTTNVGGGGGGAYARRTLSVTPSSVLNITVGTSAENADGGNTYIAKETIPTFANLGDSSTPDTNGPWDYNHTSLATPSWTPPTTGMIVAFLARRVFSGTLNPNDSMSGNGITWKKIESVILGTHILSLFAANASGAIPGPTTASFQVSRSSALSFFHVENIESDVERAFVQTVTNTATSSTSLSITLAPPSNTKNRVIAGFVTVASSAITPRTNWTEADEMHPGGGLTLETQFRSDAFETTASASSASTTLWLGIAAEIRGEFLALKAAGGKSGANGGAGGSVADSIGDVKFAGGDGTIGTGNQNGGGGAGDSGAGSGIFGGDTNGGPGGGFQGSTLRNGGGIIGGGGNSTGSAQYAGARGEARISYTTVVSSDFPTVVDRKWGRGYFIVPPSVLPGELLIVVMSSYGTSPMSIDGWTKLAEKSFSSSSVRQTVFYKRATGDDRGKVTGSSSGRYAWILYRIANGGTPFVDANVPQTIGNDSNPLPPSITGAPAANYLWITAVSYDVRSSRNIIAPPQNYGNFIIVPEELFDVNNRDERLAAADRELSASAEYPGRFTSESADWVAVTIAVPYKAQAQFTDVSQILTTTFPAAKERLYVSTTDDVKFLSQENTQWGSLWKGIVQQDALDPAYPRVMKTFGIGNILFIGNGSYLHSIAPRAVDESGATPNRIVFPSTHFVKWMVTTKQAVFVGLEHKESQYLPSFVLYYEPLSELVRMVEIPEGTTVGFFKNENCWLIDITGKIRAWDGSRFVTRNYLPPYFRGEKIKDLPHRNAFVHKDGSVHFLWKGQYPYPAGVWTYSEEDDIVYHKGGLVFDRENLNSFGAILGTGDWRALYYDGNNLLAGASTTDGTTTFSGIYSDKRVGITVPETNRGWFKTAKIASPSIDAVWRNLLVKYDPLREGIKTGEIRVKVRYSNPKIAENSNAPAFTGQLTSATSLTCNTPAFISAVDAGNISVGDEIIFASGKNAGVLAHITTITGAVGAQKTVTFDEGLPDSTSGTCTFFVENWTLLSPSITSSDKLSALIDLPRDYSEWVQFKVESRGEFDIEELQVGYRENLEVEKP